MKKCLACGKELYDTPLLIMENMPKSAELLLPQNIEEDFPITLKLCQCKYCGLIQLDNKPVDYYRDSVRASGMFDSLCI